MTFELEIAGRVITAQVEPLEGAGRGGGRFRLVLGVAGEDVADPARETVVVDARPTDLGLTVLYEGEGRAVDAAITARAGGEYLVQFPHVDVPVLVDGRRGRRGKAADGHGTGEQRVVAPMPGRVVRVLVAAGETVAARQGLVVVEAMKMENELGAARAGRVRDVVVSEGESVEAGRLLLVVE
jgi:biotin carboxyl carrier protein